MKDFLSKQWSLEKRFMRDGFGQTLINCAIAFAALIVVGFVACLLFQPAMDMLVAYLSAFMSSSGIIDDSGSVSVPLLLANNIRASIFSILFGVFPFVYLPAFPLGLNSTLIGAMGAYYVVNRLSIAAFFAGMLPHGIFEIPALVISFSLGIYLCREITASVRAKDKESMKPLKAIFINLARTYVMLVAPLLIIAAVVEGFVTPAVMHMFI
jgi:stage II sporulation protein M